MNSKSLFFGFLMHLSTTAFSQTISDESRNLAKCEGVYLYAAHLSQMQNNEGLAKNLLYRASSVTTTHLFLNENGGRVKGEIIEQIKSVRRAGKSSLDADPYGVYTKAGDCDKSCSGSISKARNMNKIWDGRNFDEWHLMIFQESMKAMGIK